MDRNTFLTAENAIRVRSLSARRAWIEIFYRQRKCGQGASLSARRAWIEIPANLLNKVIRPVALRKESVDRNIVDEAKKAPTIKSLSARRAWIEIPILRCRKSVVYVALRKESVDRNSASPRRIKSFSVALRKESVDRNKRVLERWIN